MRRVLQLSLISSLLIVSGTGMSLGQTSPMPQHCQVNPTSDCLDTILDRLLAKIEAEQDGNSRQEYLSGIAVTLISEGKFQRAERFARGIQADNLREQNLGSIASGYAENGQLDDARRVLKSIESPIIRGIVEVAISGADLDSDAVDENLQRLAKIENPSLRDSGFSEVAKEIALSGNYERAKEIAELMAPGGLKNHLLGWLALEQLDVSPIDDVIATLNGISPADQRVIAQSHLAKELSIRGNEAVSKRLFDQSRQMLDQLDLKADRILVLREKLAMDNSDAGNQQIALDIAQGIEDPVRKIGVYSYIAGNYANNAKKPQAIELLLRGVEKTKKIDPEPERANIQSMLSRRLAQLGAAAEAALIADFVEDIHSRSLAMQEIGFILLRQGDLAQAGQVFRQIPDPDFKDHTLLHLAVALQEAGQTDEAVDLLEEVIADVRQRPQSPLLDIIYPPMAVLQLKLERQDDAIVSLMQISDPDVRIEKLLSVAKHASKNGETKFAALLSEKALEETEQLKNTDRQMHWLSTMILQHPANFDLGDIEGLVGLIEEDQRKNSFITTLAYGFLDKGLADRAQMLINELADQETRDWFELAMLGLLLNDALKN
ncbi:tetratricopeptide repeat protein [Roseibium album]|uniref:tetratricopeptide repeat protein n=1 Tax=Roseibium album TaxID=311410 RepID=UPI003918B5F9